MEENTKDLQDYLVALRKHKSGILTIAIAIVVISSAVAFLLPSTYKSSATILIEQQEIPPDLVQSTVTSYAAERIQTIQARVMSRTNLLQLVDKFELYPDVRKRETSEEIVARMREDFSLDLISAEVVDPRTGRPSVATIAFSLSFKGESPAKVQRVANEMTSLFLNENLRSRTQKAEETSVFLTTETERLGSQISELEQKLAKFKQENADMLPELQQLNMQMLQRAENDVAESESRLGSLAERKFYLQNQLALIDPGSTDSNSPGARLKYLESAYASAKSRYSDDHPDVQNLKSEIDSLRNVVGASGKSDLVAQQLGELRTELAQKRQKYTPDHPDVIALESRIRQLSDELKNAKSVPENDYYSANPDNPLYLSTRTQLASVDSDIKVTKQQLEKLKIKALLMEEKLLKAPQVERVYLTLQRDYENAITRYRETKAKQMKADVAKQLESESKGERFTLIDPAALPEKPISPNRPAILFLGFVLAMGGGIGFAFVADIISGAVRGVKSVQGLLGVAPLAVIPYQVNTAEIEKKSTVRKRTILLAILTVITAVLIIHVLISPLDVLWFRVLRKVEHMFF